ncbi:MAG: GGDEF domain-containing protein [Thiotrichales bacterium]|nr:GGDEF domain-containing protein [Thiotrichales bacterium]
MLADITSGRVKLQNELSYQQQLATKVRVRALWFSWLALLLFALVMLLKEEIFSATILALAWLGLSVTAVFEQKKRAALAAFGLTSALFFLYLATLLNSSFVLSAVSYWVLVFVILIVFIHRFSVGLVWLGVLSLPFALAWQWSGFAWSQSILGHTNLLFAVGLSTILLYGLKEFFIRAEAHVHLVNRELEYQQKIVDHSVPMLKIDLQGKITCVSLAMAKILGRGVNQLSGVAFSDLKLVSLSTDPQIWQEERHGWNGILYSEAGSKSAWLDALIRPEFDAFANKVGYSMIAENVTRQQSLENQASHDQLTGALNRRVFDEFIYQSIEAFNRHQSPVCLVLCDLDHFKQVNDTYGHLTGDNVLKAFYTLLHNSLRQTDSLARWGGEEFAILLPMTEQETAYKVVEKIREKVQQHLWPKGIQLTASFGLCQLHAGCDAKNWFEAVDKALYQAKQTGRNRVCVCTEGDIQEALQESV